MPLPTHDPKRQQAMGESLDAAIDGLRARALLEPALLLSAGYVALPFLLQQGSLLLAPLLTLCGLPLERKETTRAIPE